MKKFLSILLILLLLSSTLLFSCEDKNKSKEQKQPEGNEQDAEINKEKAILDNVVFLMNEDIDVENSNDVINNFFGDFMIDGFVQSSEASIISRFYKIDNILATEYKDGSVIYQAVKGGELYFISKFPNNSSLSVDKHEQENEWPLSIFDVFGFDMGDIFSNNEESSDDEFPKVTYDDLTLSEDQTVVTYSDEYLKAITKHLMESFDFTENEKEDFTDDIFINCEFTVPDQTFSFGFDGKFEGYGDLSAEMIVSFKDNLPCDYMVSISLTTEVEGIPLTMTVEIKQNDIVYDKDNNVVSANFLVHKIQECQYLIDGITVDYSLATDNYFSFVCENSAPKAFSMLSETKELMSHTEASKTTTSSKELIVENSTLRYTESADGKVVERVTSDHVSLTTPENVTIPQNVYAAIRK